MLGSGSFATVTKEQDSEGAQVAVKQTKSWDTAIESFVEAGILATFDHPHLLHSTEIGYRETICFTLPLGTDLCKIELYSIAYERKLEWVYQLFSALELLHSYSLIHRDIKPDNILIINEQAVLADFGLAVYDYGQAKAVTSVVEFRAPEIQPNAKYTTKVDIYALGKTLAYLFDPFELTLAPALAELLRRCTEEVPIMRPTATEVLADELFAAFAPITGNCHRATVQKARLPDPKDERTCYEWLEDVGKEYRFPSWAVPRGVSFFERVLAVYLPSKKEYQLYLLTTLYLALLYTDETLGDFQKWVDLADGEYTVSQFREALKETVMLLRYDYLPFNAYKRCLSPVLEPAKRRKHCEPETHEVL